MEIASNSRSKTGDRPIRVFGACVLAFACIAIPALAPAQELGRLFLTPEQRQDLERRRATNRAEEEAPQIREGPLTVNGHIERSSGKTATWVNGVPQYDKLSSRDPAKVALEPNEGEPKVSLKVGQTLDRSSGTVRDGLGEGEVTVRRTLPLKTGT